MAPGEILFFDGAGNLRVQNEADDIEGYRRYFVAEAPELPAAASPMGGDYDGGFGDILEGMPPMPGARGRPPGIGGRSP
jgi:hypothetical protein